MRRRQAVGTLPSMDETCDKLASSRIRAGFADLNSGFDSTKNSGWSRPVKKTIYTLNIGDYAPEICALTYPLIQAYARKIGADFHVIRERKFPEWPIVYEKLQIYELGRKHGNDWNIFVDSDTLINPEMFDVTEHLHKDTVSIQDITSGLHRLQASQNGQTLRKN